MPVSSRDLRRTYVALAGIDTALASRRSGVARRARWVTKPLLMPLLAASMNRATAATGGGATAGAVSGGCGRSRPRGRAAARRTRRLRRGTRAAQLLSWAGDVALLGSGRTSFLSGVAAFGAAHVAYIDGFVGAKDADEGPTARGPVTAGAIFSLAAPVMASAAARKDPALRGPVIGYSGLLVTMFATSTLLHRSIPAEARRRLVAGTSLFLLSDTLLGIQEFVKDQPSRTLESAVMATYTAGQLAIADGVVAAD